MCGSFMQKVRVDVNYFGANKHAPVLPTVAASASTSSSTLPPAPTQTQQATQTSTQTSTQSSTPVSVFITGCHMSPNPAPGVGLARALRAHFSSRQLHIVAVDDMVGDSFQGLTDHIFDDVRSFKVGSEVDKKGGGDSGRERDGDLDCVVAASPALGCSSQPLTHSNSHSNSNSISHITLSQESEQIDDACWEAILTWLAPTLPSHTFPQNPHVAFLLPASDKDVRLLAHKKRSILTQQETEMTPIIGTTRHDELSGHHISSDTQDRNRDAIACSRILCPSLQAVGMCRKPQITAARYMDCFVVPEFLVLSAAVCLAEVQAFCEVEYPVMFKVKFEIYELCCVLFCCLAFLYYYVGVLTPSPLILMLQH